MKTLEQRRREAARKAALVADLHVYGGGALVAVGAGLALGAAAGLVVGGAFLAYLGLFYGRRPEQ